VIESAADGRMSVVGDLFGAGKMFLAQVVNPRAVMKNPSAYLTPYMEAEKAAMAAAWRSRLRRKQDRLATVKAESDDIGRTLSAFVLACNNYE